MGREREMWKRSAVESQTRPAALFLSNNFWKMMSLFIKKKKKKEKEKMRLCLRPDDSEGREGGKVRMEGRPGERERDAESKTGGRERERGSEQLKEMNNSRRRKEES